MRAAWYEMQGPARDVLTVGTMPDPQPGQGEVRVRISVSGVNPGDVKKRQNAFGYGMPDPRVIPHSDGAGHIDRVGEAVSSELLGSRVWCYGAQSYRPFGTAAEYTVVPIAQAVALADDVAFEQGACLGIPGITAYQAVYAAGPVDGRTVLVQGGAGAVGVCAVQLARRAGAVVIATVRTPADESSVRRAGAHHVLRADADIVDRVRAIAPTGVDHIVDVAFGANVVNDVELLAPGGSIATYATDRDQPAIPFWPLAFKNVRMFFLGSDDFPSEVKRRAAQALNEAFAFGWDGFEIAERISLSDIARAHEHVESPTRPGRVVVVL